MIFKRQPKDPNARVQADLAVLRQQHHENDQRGIGLMNMPKHQRAKRDLVVMGADAVPALVQVLVAPHASTDTPEGQVEDGVANDIAEVLGDIGDPRAVEPLMAQFKRHIVSAQPALASFSAGVDALLRGLGDSDEFVRGCCIRGLGLAKVERALAAGGVAKALGDSDASNRGDAALAARRLGVADPQLVAALQRVATDDPSERVRGKAQDAIWELNTVSSRT